MVDPRDVLPDDRDSAEIAGVTVRKGSVGAFMANVRILQDSASSDSDRAAAEEALSRLVPALQALGLFDLFAIRDPRIAALVERCLNESSP